MASQREHRLRPIPLDRGKAAGRSHVGTPPTEAKSAAGNKRVGPTLGDQVLTLASGKTVREIIAACKGARPNHVGVLIARHKRAGRIEERDGKLYATHSIAIEQGAAS